MDLNHRPSGCHPDALPAELTDQHRPELNISKKYKILADVEASGGTQSPAVENAFGVAGLAREFSGEIRDYNGSNGARTHDLLVVTLTLSQLSYASVCFYIIAPFYKKIQF